MTTPRTRNNTLCTPPADPVAGPAGDAGGGASSRRLSATEATAPKSLTDTILAVLLSDDSAGVMKHASNCRKIEALRAENNGTFAAAWNEALHAKRETTGSGVMESLAAAAGIGGPTSADGDPDADIKFDPATIEAEASATTEASAGTLPTVNALLWTLAEPPPHQPVLEDVFDLGDKLQIVGPSKVRKSFFLLELAISLASGIEFLHFRSARAFRVLVVQMEIREGHYHRRFKRMFDALGQPDIRDRLHVTSARGLSGLAMEDVKRTALAVGAEVIAFDPLYKILTGDENSAEDIKPLLAEFDMLAEATGAAVIFVHHDAKGPVHERATRDRGSGSNVLNRDYDACFTLTPHRDSEDTVVLNTLLRNYPPREAFCASWQDGRFVYDYGVAPVTGRAGKYDAALRTACERNPTGSLADIAAVVGCDRSTVKRYRDRAGGVA